MSVADSLAKMMPALNSIHGKLGFSKWTLTIRSEFSNVNKQAFMNGENDSGITTTDLVILEQGQNPAMDFHGQNPNLDKPARGFESLELALPQEGYVRVGPISPKSINGGYTPEELRGSPLADAVHYIINGPDQDNVKYQLVLLNTRDPLGYFLTIRTAA